MKKKKYPVGTQLRVLTDRYNNYPQYSFIHKDAILTISNLGVMGYGFEKNTHEWNSSFIEDTNNFEEYFRDWKEVLKNG